MIINYYYNRLHETKGALSVVSSAGAVGHNKTGYVDVGVQREALWTLRYGVLLQSPDHVSRAVRAFEYGFEHQNPIGYFENTLGIDPAVAVGGDAFFMAAFYTACCMLKDDPAHTAEFARLATLKGGAADAMKWLDANKATLYQQDARTPNRLLFDAIAFYLSSKFTGYDKHRILGETFITAALAAQITDGGTLDGSFTEKGGYDSSYQGVSLCNIADLYPYCGDEALRSKLVAAMGKGVDWLASRIYDNGAVNVEGNSRTGLGQEVQSGKLKEPNLAEIARALIDCGGILDDRAIIVTGEKVVKNALNLQ